MEIKEPLKIITMKTHQFIPLSIPNFIGNEQKYISEAIQNKWVSTGGSFVRDFENKISLYVGSKGAVACQNGTSGIHIALLVVGVKPNDEVIVPTLTFIAAVNPVKYVFAEPVFMDCDDSLTIDPIKLLSFCQKECTFNGQHLINKITGRTIKAIIVVHIFGNITNMEKIMAIAKTYQLKVIEDATEALGTNYIKGPYQGKFAGVIGDIGIFSFNGNKIITTGGGGMIVSNHLPYLVKAKHLTTQAKVDEVYFIHDEIGYNYRMTNLQAALGLAQLETLETFIHTKRENYHYYLDLFKLDNTYTLLPFDANIRPNYWFYSLIGLTQKIQIKPFIDRMLKKQTQVRPIWGLIHQQKPYIHAQAYQISKAFEYVNKVINIPCSSNLTKEDVFEVYQRIKDI